MFQSVCSGVPDKYALLAKDVPVVVFTLAIMVRVASVLLFKLGMVHKPVDGVYVPAVVM